MLSSGANSYDIAWSHIQPVNCISGETAVNVTDVPLHISVAEAEAVMVGFAKTVTTTG